MGTQLNYAAWAQCCGSASVPTAPALSSLRLLSPPRATALLHLRDGAVVLYRRAGSLVWQVRFKLWDQRWHRCSTRHRDQHMAIRAAGDIYDRAKFCEASGVPLTSIDAALVREYEVWRNERMPLSNWLMWLVVSTNMACRVFSADLRLCCAARLKLSTSSMTR